MDVERSGADPTASVDERSAPELRPRGGRWRKTLAIVLLIIGGLLTPVSIVAVWTRNQVLSTDRYVRTVAPLSEDPLIQDAVARRLSAAMVQGVDVQNLAERVLPGRADQFAPVISGAVQSFAEDQILQIVESPEFSAIWERASRIAHRQLVTVLTGEDGDAVVVEDGVVSLDLSALAADVRQRLAARGVDIFGERVLVGPSSRIALFDGQQLESAQSATDLLRKIAWVLPLAALACLAGAVLLWPSRRRGLIVAALAFAGSMAIGLALLAVGRKLYLDAAESGAFRRDVAAALFDTMIHYLKAALRIGALLGLLVALLAWLPGKPAGGPEPSSAARAVAAHRGPLLAVPVVGACVIIVAADQPGVTAVVAALLLLVVGAGLVESLARQGRRLAPAAE